MSRRVFVVGPKCVGKSNLLDVFRFLNDVVSVGGGLGLRTLPLVERVQALTVRLGHHAT